MIRISKTLKKISFWDSKKRKDFLHLLKYHIQFIVAAIMEKLLFTLPTNTKTFFGRIRSNPKSLYSFKNTNDMP